jgi:hypothetical protein
MSEAIPIDVIRKLAGHGGDRRSEKVRVDQACDARLKYGSRDYWLARLQRDGQTSPNISAARVYQ